MGGPSGQRALQPNGLYSPYFKVLNMFDRKAYDKKYRARPEYKAQRRGHQVNYNASGKQRKKWFEYRNRNARWVADYKSEQGCLFCREDCPACLVCHHNGDKEIGVAVLVARGAALKTVQQEVEKCVVLCHNCHNKLHVGFICFG